MAHTARRFGAAGAALALLGLGGGPVVAEEEKPAAVELPAYADEAVTTVHAAVAPGGKIVAVTTSGLEGRIAFASSADGKSFSKPVLVDGTDTYMTGGRRGPRVAATKDAIVVTAITQWARKGGGGDLVSFRSNDGGATWSKPVRVNDVDESAREGLHDLAAMTDGRFVSVWLDLPGKGTVLAADFSADGGATWQKDVTAYESPDGSICECCHPAVAADPAGGAVAAFRNSVGGEREIWQLRLPAGGTQFGQSEKSGKGSWKIAACPMAGPSVVAGRAGSIKTTWRRESDVYFADGLERRVGPGTEPQVALDSGGAEHLFWLEGARLMHLPPHHLSPPKRPPPVEVASDASFPVALSSTDGRPWVLWLDPTRKRAFVRRMP